jgi:hypothetical protein
VFAEHILISNGLQAQNPGKMSGLCVEVEYPGRVVMLFDNLDLREVKPKVEKFRSAFEVLCTRLSERDFVAGMPISSGEILRDLVSREEKLLSKVLAGLEGVYCDFEELDSLRQELVQAVLAALAPQSGENLASALDAALPVLEMLVSRRPRSPNSEPTVADIHGLAAAFSARVLSKGMVKRNVVLEHKHLISTEKYSDLVEHLVNNTYSRAGGDRVASPILFRKHGMSGDALRTEAASYVQSMKEIEGIFSEIGYETILCYGTLLGAIREGAFIAHDDDVDMAVLMKRSKDLDVREEWQEILSSLARRKVLSDFADRFLFIKVTAPNGGKRSDIFPIIPVSDSMVDMYMEDLRIRKVRREIVTPFRQINFYGETFGAPADCEAFLSDRYGLDWRIPRRPVGGRWTEHTHDKGGRNKADDAAAGQAI